MKRFFSYFIFLITLVVTLLLLLQSTYLVLLRFSLFSFTTQSFNLESLSLQKANIAFIQHMVILLLIVCVVEISLFWLLVILNRLSQRQGLIATLVLIILVGFIVLFAFSAFIV